MRGHTEAVRGVVHLPDGRHIITCSYDASLRLWDLESGAQIGNNWQDDGDQASVLTIALSPNGKTVASGSTSGMVKLWDIETRKVTVKWTGHTDHVWSVCWSADGMRVASGSVDGTVRVWEMESGETVLGPIKTGNKYVKAVAYWPDSSNIATGGNKGIEIWDTTTGERLSTPQQDSQARSLAWTSDQRKLIAGFSNGSIRIFNTTTWEQIAILEGHTDYVRAISLLQNDRLFASASGDNTARLWNLDTNLPVGPALQHPSGLWDAALSADGKFLVTACDNENAYVWNTHTILKDSGLEDLLSVPSNVTDVKSTLDSDATRRPKKAAVPRSIPLAFFDEMRDDINPSMAPSPTNPPPAAACTIPPPATADSDPAAPASTTSADPPSRHRLPHILASFSLSGAHALLRRAFPVFRHSPPNTNLSMNLPEQHLNQPANVEVPAVMDNQSDVIPRLAQDERHPSSPGLLVDAQDRIHQSTTRTNPPSSEYHRRQAIATSSRSSTRPLLGPISEHFRGSHPNTDESTELQEVPVPDHEPAIVEFL